MAGYFTAVFLMSWALWFAADAMPLPVLSTIAFYMGVFTPGLIALAVTRHRHGPEGVRTLLRRLVKFDVGAGWFVFALFFIAVLKLLVALIVRISTGAWPVFGTVPLPLLLAAAIGATMLGGQVGEELGWRGYALPRMARVMGPGAASVLLGVLWAVWHLPLFFILGGDTVGQSFPFYLLQVTALSVALGWVYMKTQGSLLVTMLLHAAINNTKDIVPSAAPGATNPLALHATLVGWLTLAILWLCAAWFLFDMRRDRSIAHLMPA